MEGRQQLKREGWNHIHTYGHDFLVYAKGSDRLVFDDKTGNVVTEYSMGRPMTRRVNWENWEPDAHEVYEYDLCRLRNVYWMRTARETHFCDHCNEPIMKGEKYDAVGVKGAGLGGLLHLRRLHILCRAPYIVKQNDKFADAYGILVMICGWCGFYLGFKKTTGDPGISHGICGDCRNEWLAEKEFCGCGAPRGKQMGFCDDCWADELMETPEVSF